MLWRINAIAISPGGEHALKVRSRFNGISTNLLEEHVYQDSSVYADCAGGYALWRDRGDIQSDLIPGNNLPDDAIHTMRRENRFSASISRVLQ